MASAIIQFTPIGNVHNGISQAHRDTHWDAVESEIILGDEWIDALDGVAEYSHIWVVFHIHNIPPPDTLRIRPMKHDARSVPRVGIFATRSPQRPNPIGIAAVQLLEVRGNVLRVRGLDALDGTPVLDIKPYLALGDAISDTRVPDWIKQYWRSRDQDPKGVETKIPGFLKKPGI